MPVKIPLIRPSYASRASLEADYPAGGLMNARARPWALVDTNNVRTWSWPHQEDEELVSRHMKIISIHQRAEREVNSSSKLTIHQVGHVAINVGVCAIHLRRFVVNLDANLPESTSYQGQHFG